MMNRCYVDFAGHHLEPRFEEKLPDGATISNILSRMRLSGDPDMVSDDPILVLRALKLKSYIGDICVTCGQWASRPIKGEP